MDKLAAFHNFKETFIFMERQAAVHGGLTPNRSPFFKESSHHATTISNVMSCCADHSVDRILSGCNCQASGTSSVGLPRPKCSNSCP
jgi:hypothetical protein